MQYHVNSLVQACGISIVSAFGVRQSCAKPPMLTWNLFSYEWAVLRKQVNEILGIGEEMIQSLHICKIAAACNSLYQARNPSI